MVAIYTFYRIIMVKGRLVNPFDSEVFDGESGDSADNGISGMRPVALRDEDRSTNPPGTDNFLEVSIPPSRVVPDIALPEEQDTRRFPRLVRVDGKPELSSEVDELNVERITLNVVSDVASAMVGGEGFRCADDKRSSERPTVPGFTALASRFQIGSNGYKPFLAIVNTLSEEFVYEWWFSGNPLERLYGQLNGGIWVFNYEQICKDIVAVLGEDCLKEVFNADGKIGHDQWKLLKIEVENKYPEGDLAKIILRK